LNKLSFYVFEKVFLSIVVPALPARRSLVRRLGVLIEGSNESKDAGSSLRDKRVAWFDKLTTSDLNEISLCGIGLVFLSLILSLSKDK
jgi:hypothetical protein